MTVQHRRSPIFIRCGGGGSRHGRLVISEPFPFVVTRIGHASSLCCRKLSRADLFREREVFDLQNVAAGHGSTSNKIEKGSKSGAGQLMALGIGTIIGGMLGIVLGYSMIGGAVTTVSMTMVGGSIGAAVGLKW